MILSVCPVSCHAAHIARPNQPPKIPLFFVSSCLCVFVAKKAVCPKRNRRLLHIVPHTPEPAPHQPIHPRIFRPREAPISAPRMILREKRRPSAQSLKTAAIGAAAV